MTDRPAETGDPDAGDPAYCAYTDYEERPVPEEADLPATGAGTTGLERRVWDALATVEDPEMPVSIVDLGLVYGVDVTDGRATVSMTLTYTGCPARDMLQDDVEAAVAAVDGIEAATVDLVWSPPWSLEMVTEQGERDLREFGVSI
jgi:metal-sulfur cluster biosynthetic enzyme